MEIVSLSYTLSKLHVLICKFVLHFLLILCHLLAKHTFQMLSTLQIGQVVDWIGGGLDSWLDWIVLFDDFNALSLSEV